MEHFFITFGPDHQDHLGYTLYKMFVVISAADECAARKKIAKVRGQRWAGIYPISELSEQIDSYNLEEIALDKLF